METPDLDADDKGLDAAEEIAVLSELRSTELIKIISLLQAGVTLSKALKTSAHSVVSKVSENVRQQYETSEVSSSLTNSIEDPLNPLENKLVKDSIIQEVEQKKIERMLKLAKIAPLRLTSDERVLLRYLEASLEVSEYTDKIDVIGRWSASSQMATEIESICSILSGLLLANRYDAGQRIVKNRSFEENAEFFRNAFEIGRRYKMINPDKMRTTYGKLIYCLMDSRIANVASRLKFDCVAPVKTVSSLIFSRKFGMKLLEDPLFEIATREIYSEGKDRSQVAYEISKKAEALEELKKKYATSRNNCDASLVHRTLQLGTQQSHSTETEDFTAEEVEQCVNSFSDYNNFIHFNRRPCEEIIEYLKTYFNPRKPTPLTDLSIAYGVNGSRLSHSHERQFRYVYGSLCLWSEVMNELLALWNSAEHDLLNPSNPYSLRDTGQGLNRVQDAPKVYSHMITILNDAKQKVKCWDGSSAIHLGDQNVPNAFMFIDKYSQIPRILSQVVLCIKKIPELMQNQYLKNFIEKNYQSEHDLKLCILRDFFCHAFDGSGADNYFNAGSCIDGRLTSAWNWCSLIEKKPYFSIFLLSGFTGFDSRF